MEGRLLVRLRDFKGKEDNFSCQRIIQKARISPQMSVHFTSSQFGENVVKVLKLVA